MHNDRGRDYTIQDAGIVTTPQAPGLPASSGWQVYPQSTPSTYVGNGYVTGQATVPQSQMMQWNPGTSSGSFVSAPNMFPTQTFPQPPIPQYSVSSISTAPTGTLQASQPSAAPTTQPPYYS